MSRAKKLRRRNFRAEVQAVAFEVLKDHRNVGLSGMEVAKLVVKSGRLEPEFVDAIHEKALYDYIRRAMRARTFDRDYGDVRQFHCYSKFIQTEGGKEKQQHLWKTVDNMSRIEMIDSIRTRQAQKENIDRKCMNDARYWDEEVAPKIHAKPISKQLGFEF